MNRFRKRNFIVSIIYKMSILFSFMSFIGVEMTQAMDEKKAEFREVKLGNGSPRHSPREEKENPTNMNEEKDEFKEAPLKKEGNKTPPNKTDENKNMQTINLKKGNGSPEHSPRIEGKNTTTPPNTNENKKFDCTIF